MTTPKRLKMDVEAASKHKDKEDQPVTYYSLKNQGATCYLSSVLQILFMTTEIHESLEGKPPDHKLKRIFGDLKKKPCGTEEITETLGITDVHQQRDAAECLEKILYKFGSSVYKFFQGELNYTTTCSEGHSIIEETNPFLILPVSLKDGGSKNYEVEPGFKEIFQEKSLNMVYCPECDKKTEATSKCQMTKFPVILILLLKRFDRDLRTMKYVKSDRCVEIPRSLQRENKTYKLYGMVNHMGELSGGHYTATILSEKDQTWYEFNDSHVAKAVEQPFANDGPYKTAYLLVYRGSREDKLKEKQDGITCIDDQKGHKEECPTKPDGRDSRDKKRKEVKKLTQELMEKQTKKEREREKKESFMKNETESKPLLPQTQTSDNKSEPHRDNQQKVEEEIPTSERRDQTGQDKESSASILKKRLVKAAIVGGGVAIFGCVALIIFKVVKTYNEF